MLKWTPLALTFLAAVISVLVAPQLPATIVSHWNWRGQPDGWAPTWMGVSVVPVTMLILIGVFHVLPRLDTLRENYRKFWPEYQRITVAITAMLLATHLAMLANALDYHVDMIKTSVVLTGLLFAVIGNYMPRLRQNHVAGFRTAATLASEYVWTHTHRVGGSVMMATGVLMALSALAPPAWAIAIVIALVAVSTTGIFIYSGRIARRERASLGLSR